MPSSWPCLWPLDTHGPNWRGLDTVNLDRQREGQTGLVQTVQVEQGLTQRRAGRDQRAMVEEIAFPRLLGLEVEPDQRRFRGRDVLGRLRTEPRRAPPEVLSPPSSIVVAGHQQDDAARSVVAQPRPNLLNGYFRAILDVPQVHHGRNARKTLERDGVDRHPIARDVVGGFDMCPVVREQAQICEPPGPPRAGGSDILDDKSRKPLGRIFWHSFGKGYGQVDDLYIRHTRFLSLPLRGGTGHSLLLSISRTWKNGVIFTAHSSHSRSVTLSATIPPPAKRLSRLRSKRPVRIARAKSALSRPAQYPNPPAKNSRSKGSASRSSSAATALGRPQIVAGG